MLQQQRRFELTAGTLPEEEWHELQRLGRRRLVTRSAGVQGSGQQAGECGGWQRGGREEVVEHAKSVLRRWTSHAGRRWRRVQEALDGGDVLLQRRWRRRRGDAELRLVGIGHGRARGVGRRWRAECRGVGSG